MVEQLVHAHGLYDPLTCDRVGEEFSGGFIAPAGRLIFPPETLIVPSFFQQSDDRVDALVGEVLVLDVATQDRHDVMTGAEGN